MTGATNNVEQQCKMFNELDNAMIERVLEKNRITLMHPWMEEEETKCV